MTLDERHDAYLVTRSDIPGITLGAVLLDTGGDEDGREWTSLDFESEETREADGKWLLRVCATCRVEHHTAAVHGHEGEHGTDEVREAGRIAVMSASDKARVP